MEHRVHILGFLVPVKITDEQEAQIRNLIIGADETTNYFSLGDENRTILVRSAGIVAIESRAPGAKWSYTVERQSPPLG